MKSALKLAMYILVAVLLLGSVAGIGVAPAKKVINFEPGKTQQVSLKIINNQHKDLKAVIYARGELAEYFSLRQTLVAMSAEEPTKEFSFNVKMPDSLKPGAHETEIVILEFPKEFASEEETTVISAVGSVVSSVIIRVPYPGKYAEADLYVSQAQVNEHVLFTIPIHNFGVEDITNAKATITVYGATYEEIAKIETDAISIKAKTGSKLTGSWLANVNPGIYHAVAIVEYDGKKIRLEKNFNVGSLFVDITNIVVPKFSLGDIAKFDIYIKSKWNQPISNVYAEMTVSDSEGTEYTRFKTASVDLEAEGSGKLEAYWDTKDVPIGEYLLKVILHYAGKTTERVVGATVNIDSIVTDFTTAKVVAQKPTFSRDTVLLLVIVILVIINISWLIYFRRARRT